MTTIPAPRPPTCDDCPTVIDSEDVLWHGHCPCWPLWGHTLELEGLNQLWHYLEAQDANRS